MSKLLYLISCIGICMVIYLLYNHDSFEVTSPHPFIARPENTVFVFDLHGVVFQKDVVGMLQTASKAPFSINIFLLLANPFFWYNFLLLFFTRDSTEEIIFKLAGMYPLLKKYIPTAIDIINEQLPIQTTVSTIRKLKQQGFRLFIFSNIGITTFKKLTQKFPDIFSYFDGYQVTNPTDNWLQKPHRNAYEKFIQSFGLESYNIVFIDDKKSNIRTAQALGMYGIHYNSIEGLSRHIQLLHALP